jgi:hypothetical protein
LTKYFTAGILDSSVGKMNSARGHDRLSRISPARRFFALAKKDMRAAVIVSPLRERTGCMPVAGTPAEEKVNLVKNVPEIPRVFLIIGSGVLILKEGL